MFGKDAYIFIASKKYNAESVKRYWVRLVCIIIIPVFAVSVAETIVLYAANEYSNVKLFFLQLALDLLFDIV